MAAEMSCGAAIVGIVRDEAEAAVEIFGAAGGVEGDGGDFRGTGIDAGEKLADETTSPALALTGRMDVEGVQPPLIFVRLQAAGGDQVIIDE